MTTFTKKLLPIASGLLLILFCLGCGDTEERGSLNDITTPETSQPTVTSISPAGSALAGVDTLIITGTNFSSLVGENIVYFNSSFGTILQASPTQLVVLPPLVLGDSVIIRIAVRSSDKLSSTLFYELKAAAVEFGALSPTESASGVTTDASGNLYVGIAAVGVDQGIFKYAPDGSKSQHAPATPGTAKWNSLTWGPTGFIYANRNVRAVYRYTVGGGSAAAIWKAFPTGISIADGDFDSDKNFWCGGNNTEIFVIKPDLSTKSYPFVGNIRTVRVFNGFLYFSASVSSVSQIWRAQIIGDSISTPTVYFDFAAAIGTTRNAYGITFASDGTMFVATEAPDGVVVVTASGTASSPFLTYQALFGTAAKALAWGSGDALYATTEEGGLVLLSTRKSSAPYYGTQ